MGPCAGKDLEVNAPGWDLAKYDFTREQSKFIGQHSGFQNIL